MRFSVFVHKSEKQHLKTFFVTEDLRGIITCWLRIYDGYSVDYAYLLMIKMIRIRSNNNTFCNKTPTHQYPTFNQPFIQPYDIEYTIEFSFHMFFFISICNYRTIRIAINRYTFTGIILPQIEFMLRRRRTNEEYAKHLWKLRDHLPPSWRIAHSK